MVSETTECLTCGAAVLNKARHAEWHGGEASKAKKATQRTPYDAKARPGR